MADEKKLDDAFALEIDGKAQYPQIVGQKIEGNKVVAGVVVNSPAEHKKWLEENEPKEGKPAWGKP